jgi:SPOR domain
MSTEGQPPDDLQEAVAATLRRLRGEAGEQQAGGARRVEPQFSSSPAASPATLAAPAATGAPTLAKQLAADLANQPMPEPDLLTPITGNAEIPPSPQNRAALRQGLAAKIEAEDAHEARRHRIRYALVLIAVAALVGVGWWAYRNYAGRLRGGEVPVISAQQTPEKVPPASQAAPETPSEDKTVYEDTAPGAGTKQKSEVLLPQPEAPVLPPAPATGVSSDSNAGPAASGSAAAAPPPPPPPAADEKAAMPDRAVGSSAGESAGVPATPAPASTLPANGSASGVANPGATNTASTGATLPTAEDTPTAAGNYRIQLAATKSEAAAEATWNRLTIKYQDILASLSLHVEKTDLGAKGIYYRVQAGPFSEKAAAKDVCVKLKAKGQQCLVKP